MAAFSEDPGFIVWGIDQTAYGPVDLATLIAWVKEERVTADTWIFVGKAGAWQRATELTELQLFFGPKTVGSQGTALASPRGIEARALRRIRILGGLTDDQLERFAQFIEVERIPQSSTVVRQGDPGDAMYFILEGELRVRVSVLGKETILATLGVGEFFGDSSLFDHGPLPADVIANTDSIVAKFPAATFDNLAQETPELATPFLRAIGKTLTARIRADNQRHDKSVRLNRVVG